MSTLVDDRRGYELQDEHHDETDDSLWFLPDPHLVVHRAAVHSDEEGDGIEHEDGLDGGNAHGVHIENDTRQPEQRGRKRLQKILEVLAYGGKATRHKREQVEEHEHEHHGDGDLKEIPVRRLAAEEKYDEQSGHETSLNDHRRDGIDGGNAREGELDLRDQVGVTLEHIDTGTQDILHIEPRDEAAHQPEDIGHIRSGLITAFQADLKGEPEAEDVNGWLGEKPEGTKHRAGGCFLQIEQAEAQDLFAPLPLFFDYLRKRAHNPHFSQWTTKRAFILPLLGWHHRILTRFFDRETPSAPYCRTIAPSFQIIAKDSMP